MVGKMVGSGSSWSGTIWVNPTAGVSTPGAATGTFTTSSQFTIAKLRTLYQGVGNIPVLDEYRVADSYGDAVGFSGSAPGAPTLDSATAGNNSVGLSVDAGNATPTHAK